MRDSKQDTDSGAATWSGVITNVRISPTADPELYRELAKSNHRERSRRLRSLALLGLYAASRCDLSPGFDQGLPPRSVSDGEGGVSNEGRRQESIKQMTQKMLGSLAL